MIRKWIVCGTHYDTPLPGYKERVFRVLDKELQLVTAFSAKDEEVKLVIITGGCKNSADEYAIEWAEANGFPHVEHMGAPGRNLKRNIEMIENEGPSLVYAFWDGYSYGTCFTIAHAVRNKREINIIDIPKREAQRPEKPLI